MLGEPGTVEALAGPDVGEHTDRTGLGQAVALSVRVLLAGALLQSSACLVNCLGGLERGVGA